MKNNDPSRFIEPRRTTKEEIKYRADLEIYFKDSLGSNVEKLQNFSKYVPTQDQRKYICRNEIFKKVLNVHGSIIECGVLYGGGLFTWAHLSEIYEPLNHTRNIIGFDTFSGFEEISDNDSTSTAYHAKKGGMAIDSYKDLLKCIELYDRSRFLKHINKIKLVKGNANDSIPEYIKNHPHLVISLLWLDFDLYEPTRVALKNFFERIPKGGIIAFDELNHELWPGETIAVIEEIGLNNVETLGIISTPSPAD